MCKFIKNNYKGLIAVDLIAYCILLNLYTHSYEFKANPKTMCYTSSLDQLRTVGTCWDKLSKKNQKKLYLVV